MKHSGRILMGNAAHCAASLKKGMTQVTRVIKNSNFIEIEIEIRSIVWIH